MTLWYIGNTSVRSPFRLRDGLAALASSSLQGNLRGTQGDGAFRTLLGERGIVSLGSDRTLSVGRKWRSALGKLGFLFPELPRGCGVRQEELGPADVITPSGWRLLRAESLPAMEECFLRALAAQLFETEGGALYSPLRHTLAVLLALERMAGEAMVSFPEMALCVQTSTGAQPPEEVAAQVLALRARRDAAGSKRRFDSAEYERAAAAMGKKATTLRDYADANLRYLKATGIVRTKGRGIALAPEKRLLAGLMARGADIPADPLERWRLLCSGAPLPTDAPDAARDVLRDLLEQAARMGVAFELGDRPLDTAADLAAARYEVEERITRRKEERYALEQPGQWREIAAYLELIAARRDRARFGGGELSIPRAEAPAYLEWALWRAFLAIGGLVSAPYEARRFQLDQDFLPVSTAPGGGPDLVCEFPGFVLAVEATLTESSRQEAAEGEPVRRHVADLALSFAGRKPVYGLFVANRVDSNTAETFRIGVWYTRGDERMELHIVPLTLAQFASFFRALLAAGRASPEALLGLMADCERGRAECEAPAWKERIGEAVSANITQYQTEEES